MDSFGLNFIELRAICPKGSLISLENFKLILIMRRSLFPFIIKCDICRLGKGQER